MRSIRRFSGILIATIVVLIVLLAVFTYLSWGTDIGVSLRYYYYLTALFTLSLILTVVGIVISEIQRTTNQVNEKLKTRVLLIQSNWIDLEKLFMKYNPQLNRLYKSMWPSIPEIQAIPDPPITPEVQMQEAHGANAVLGMIHSCVEIITSGETSDKVISLWQEPEYRGFYQAIANWMKSEILWRRWLQSGHHGEANVEIFMNHIRNVQV